MPNFKERHSGRETNIFTEVFELASANGALNLSQGSPDYAMDPRLKDFLIEAAHEDMNPYASNFALPYLKQSLIRFNAARSNPLLLKDHEISIVPGATYAIYVAFSTFIERDDEVIIFEPCYDTYIPAIEIMRAKAVCVALNENFEVDFNLLQDSITEKTKAIIVNSPQNPTGKIWGQQEWSNLWDLIKETDIVVISDEVYDLICYDGKPFISAFHHPFIKERCFCIYSFEKMFHVSGWKASYVIASEECTKAFRQIHQYLTFTINLHSQHAIARYLDVFDVNGHQYFLQQKRDLMIKSFSGLPLEAIHIAEGGLFQTYRYSTTASSFDDAAFAFNLIRKAKVASIPYSALYSDGRSSGHIRFCFAKKDETIERAAEMLHQYWK